MFITTRHAREVKITTVLRACLYALLPPQYSYMRKLKDHFGTSTLQYLNSESFLHDFLKIHPSRVPGHSIAIERRFEKRFSRLIEKSGLVPVIFSGQKELSRVAVDDRVLAILIPEAYDVSSLKFKKIYEDSTATKIVFQSRKKPRSVSIAHDIFVWEPRGLPRALSGTIVYVDRNSREMFIHGLLGLRKKYERVGNGYVLSHLIKAAIFKKENRYRALNKKPAVILSRLVYDFL